jgi:Glycosyl hydrolase family 20, catalytic domain
MITLLMVIKSSLKWNSTKLIIPLEPPQGQLRFAVPVTQNFTVSVLKSFSSMFRSKLFSTGGDEINLLCYDKDAPTQAALKSAHLTFEQALHNFPFIWVLEG